MIFSTKTAYESYKKHFEDEYGEMADEMWEHLHGDEDIIIIYQDKQLHSPFGACNELTIKRKEFKMEDLICINCGIRTVNGTFTYCDECEHELQELYDAEQVELLEEANGLAEGE